ncbi:hypothetical protein ACOMHN_061488 [Nucella lapillus]
MLVNAYTTTMINPSDIKNKFCEELNALIVAVPQSEKLISCSRTWEGITGKHGIGKCNSNGLQLLKMCATHDLIITSTLFRLSSRNKTSWMQPRSKH